MKHLLVISFLFTLYIPQLFAQEQSRTANAMSTEIEKSAIAVDSKSIAPVPDGLELQQNYPNPFNPSTNIRYSIPDRGEVALTVYDARGHEVRVLVRGVQSSGRHSVRFDASDLQSGTYHYRLEFGKSMLTKAMVLLK